MTEIRLHGLRILELENEWLSLSVLPEVGAKILTLYDKTGNRQILWENPRIRPQTYPIDANFDNYWCGGWDDAHPNQDRSYCLWPHQRDPRDQDDLALRASAAHELFGEEPKSDSARLYVGHAPGVRRRSGHAADHPGAHLHGRAVESSFAGVTWR